MRRTVALLCSIALAPGFCHAQAPSSESEAQHASGKRVYGQKCAQCHGENGDGKGVAKSFFLPRPRDFTFGLFKIRMTPSGSLPTDEDLKKVIREGMPYTGMPAWPSLSADELTSVVRYVKTFSPAFADADAVTPIEIPGAPRFSDESAQKGRKVYEENKCADCHGNLGRGDGKSSPTLKNDWDEPIRPADLTKRWTFRGGSTREDIYRTFTTGLNGTPMPSFADLIAEEDRWHLVDYVYSLSRDEPEYSTVVVASNVEAEIDLAQGGSLFEHARPGFFPVFGQVIEPGRNFFPSADAVEVKAIYNAADIAIMVTWHDMTVDTSGTNAPSMPAPEFDPESGQDTTGADYSDAVAVQMPSGSMTGSVKPYFLFGDAKNPVSVWFADLSKSDGALLVGRGSQVIEDTGKPVSMKAAYADGAWSVIFKRSRVDGEGPSFDEGVFIPVALSLWDGFNRERGNRRGVTTWYHLYLEPARGESKAIPIAGYGILTLLAEVALIGVVRRRSR